MSQISDLYAKALDADAAWMRAISEAFPHKRAGDVRYTVDAKGADGTALRAAYDACFEAKDAWHAANRAAGKTPNT